MKSSHICPWWHAYIFDNKLRRFFHKPEIMIAPYIKEGMKVMDLGCGMGYFTIAMAKMVGPKGKVIAVDIQKKMLDIMQRRAKRVNLYKRIKPHLCSADKIGVKEKVDFALAMWMLHETHNPEEFLKQVKQCLKKEARFMIVEPKLHVNKARFNELVSICEKVGYKIIDEPKVTISRAVVLTS